LSEWAAEDISLMTESDSAWTTVTVTVPEDLADAAANFVHEQGITGLELSDQPGGRMRVTAYVPAEDASVLVSSFRVYLNSLERLVADPGLLTVETAPLKIENWAVMWKDNFRPTEVGERLLVAPPWDVPPDSDRLVVVIEPAEAFGTGTHETTRFCLTLIERAVGLYEGTASLLDVGCGSGILAFGAARLGCAPVLALDNDAVAVKSAKVNAELNALEDRVIIECRGLEAGSGQWTVVAANLDPMALKANLGALVGLTARYLVISGVPLDQWEPVKSEFKDAGLTTVQELLGGEWAGGLFQATCVPNR
jgi:ribosomal protein L11 methyltransferase